MKSKESSQQLWDPIRRVDTWGLQIDTERSSALKEIITENCLALN